MRARAESKAVPILEQVAQQLQTAEPSGQADEEEARRKDRHPDYDWSKLDVVTRLTEPADNIYPRRNGNLKSSQSSENCY